MKSPLVLALALVLVVLFHVVIFLVLVLDLVAVGVLVGVVLCVIVCSGYTSLRSLLALARLMKLFFKLHPRITDMTRCITTVRSTAASCRNNRSITCDHHD